MLKHIIGNDLVKASVGVQWLANVNNPVSANIRTNVSIHAIISAVFART
jgi:hypothetical protein